MKQKKSNKIISFLNMGTMPGTVMFSVGFTYDELIKQLEENYSTKKYEEEDGLKVWLAGIENDEALKKGKFFALQRKLEHPKFPTKHLYYILLLRPFDFSDEDMIILAHECVHICQFYLPDILDRDKEIEAEAYLHSHLMRQCLRTMREN